MYFRGRFFILEVRPTSTSVTCRGYRLCLVWTSMSLRCLLFSSNEETVHPIWEVLADLGIEGEYCESAVDAVEKVTTQVFQIVITDWDDQPEAGFLLKTARELKAAQRPLTLAIVSDNAKLPEALQAGANSVLVKPIRPEQARDTLSTACELLRAKFQPGTPASAPSVASGEAPEAVALAAAAGAASAPASAPPSVPSSVTQVPEKTFRAGEFLQSPGTAPGAQFDTESEIQKSLDRAAGAEVDALTELEPTAAAVQDAATEPAEPHAEPQEPLSGWAALQARLTKSAPKPAEEAPAKSELLSYGETPSSGAPAVEPAQEQSKDFGKKEAQPESGPEAALFAYIGEPKETPEPTPEPPKKHGKILLVGALAACVALVAVPRTRQSLLILSRNALRAGGSWLNPPPAAVPQIAAQHDSFGQEGDEYKLPVTGNIPDATTDPSQIQVLPVVDPTAKPEKGSEANGGQAQSTTGDTAATDQNPASQGQTGQNQTSQNQAGQNPNTQAQASDSQVQVKEAAPVNSVEVPANAAGTTAASVPSATQAQPIAPPVQAEVPQPRPVMPTAQTPAPHPISAGSSTGIPSSLKSQIASSTPEASGAMPAEAAMSSIEPVTLPESTVRGLLDQPVDPEYPEAAKASGQRGSVVLQVFIGRDGAVQDAKFLQGSLVFARVAIDAVKQWHFKPYSMNGRAVSVQSVITLNFKPPA
jgi:periplasmic protein TonB